MTIVEIPHVPTELASPRPPEGRSLSASRWFSILCITTAVSSQAVHNFLARTVIRVHRLKLENKPIKGFVTGQSWWAASPPSGGGHPWTFTARYCRSMLFHIVVSSSPYTCSCCMCSCPIISMPSHVSTCFPNNNATCHEPLTVRWIFPRTVGVLPWSPIQFMIPGAGFQCSSLFYGFSMASSFAHKYVLRQPQGTLDGSNVWWEAM